ncbi:hypothetical protein FB567DRAFT_208482 [Paraphoma chrysanthemicola]|uniref:Uncharacterized protein n=1 Tax=Paraphoma chrysanthemicola TaxID=798071 RepID=A0A8K0VSE5_9PLEO|nr:hypothetical protein FB567DRAFT_208482 [Paraphoma chrysanthemicola]
MKINPAPFHLAQTVITGLVVVFSIAILGTSAHTLDVYNKQRTSNPWWMMMWPQHFQTQGTKAIIASAVVTFFLSAVFLVLSVIPKFALRQKYTLRALISLGTIMPSFLLSLIAIVWAHMQNRNTPEQDTIQTWSCRYQKQRPLAEDEGLPAYLSNKDFKSICQESRFALYGTLIVFLLLGISMVVTMVTWLADKWTARQSRKEGVEMGSVQS